MTLLNPNDPKLLRNMLNWLFRKKIGYLTGDMCKFDINGDQVKLQRSLQSTDTFPIVIVARHSYQEFIKTYPLVSLSELKAVLAQEYADKSLVRHVIGAPDGNQRRVCTYVFSKEIAGLLDSAWMVLPESVLLWLGHKASAILHVKTDNPFFLAAATELPVSQRLNPVLQSAERFKISQGLPGDMPTLDIAAAELPSVFYAAFKHALLNPVLHRFWRLPRFDVSPLQFKLALAASAAAAFLYLSVTSLYLQMSVSQHQQAIAALGSDVNALLDQQSRYEKQVDGYSQYQLIKQQKQFTAHLWLLVSELNRQDPSLELNNANSEDDFMILRGKTSRATALLALVQSSPLVTEAEFSAPVLREGDKESFVIRLKLTQQTKQQGVVPDAE